MDLQSLAPSLSRVLQKGILFFKTRIGKAILCLFLGSIPLCGVVAYWVSCFTALKSAEERLSLLVLSAPKKQQEKMEWEAYRMKYADANPYYFEQKIEAQSLLQNEKQKLTALLDTAMFSSHPELHKRYRYLTSDENRFAFSEEVLYSSKKWKETLLRQLRPVEIDEHDFSYVLNALEGDVKNRPQCTITDATLHHDEGGITLHIECLKRENLQ